MGDNQKGHRLKRKSEAYFDSVAKNREVIPEPAKCYPHVLERLRAFEGGQLADIGCGTGEMLSLLLRELPGRFVLHGLDLSSESLKQASNVCGEGVTLVRGDVEHLPYPDGSMDLLLCMHSFHHYPHPDRALREMCRVMRDDGCLILVENLYPPFSRIRKNVKFFLLRHPNGDIRMYSEKALAQKAKRAGFRIQEHLPVADHSQLLKLEKREA